MTDVVLSIFALIAGGVTLEMFAAGSHLKRLGYPDNWGFHLVTEPPPPDGDFPSGNPS
jgi:hypothetical protein